TRMSTEAMAVAIGVVFGVAAGIPTSIVIATVGRRKTEPMETRMQPEPSWERRRELPPVIVVNPGGQHPAGANFNNGYNGYQVQWPLAPAFAAPAPRQVHYVGGESANGEEW
ncbi:MAG: hypothetical protein IT330_11040, partial [Anaerolineae bacterium]|nr:hypothetical protein [Anaerolineae bacterium]